MKFFANFTRNDFFQLYFPTILLNHKIYDIRLADLPEIGEFPQNSLEEWECHRGLGLRSATAYVLVYDLKSPESLLYVKKLRQQICAARQYSPDMHLLPILIVGNKLDLVDSTVYGEFKELGQLIQKQWKCAYVTCSAKFNWKINAVFEEIIKVTVKLRKQASHS